MSLARDPRRPETDALKTWACEAAEFLTVEEAAAILKVKPSTVRQWVRDGRMPCYRLGPRATRFTPGLLRDFAAERLDPGRS